MEEKNINAKPVQGNRAPAKQSSNPVATGQKTAPTSSKNTVVPLRSAADQAKPATRSRIKAPKEIKPQIEKLTKAAKTAKANITTGIKNANLTNNIKKTSKSTKANIATKLNNTTKPSSTHKPSDKKMYILLVAIIAIIVILVIAIVLVSAHRNQSGGGETDDTTITVNDLTTDEEKEHTKQVLDKYVEATVEGYQRVDNEDGLNDVVVIQIKNTSDEVANLALDVVAMDDNDNVLDKTSLYAEGIGPGQTQIFQAFALSELTPEQLKAAHYKIYRANTYKLEVPQENAE